MRYLRGGPRLSTRQMGRSGLGWQGRRATAPTVSESGPGVDLAEWASGRAMRTSRAVTCDRSSVPSREGLPQHPPAHVSLRQATQTARHPQVRSRGRRAAAGRPQHACPVCCLGNSSGRGEPWLPQGGLPQRTGLAPRVVTGRPSPRLLREKGLQVERVSEEVRSPRRAAPEGSARLRGVRRALRPRPSPRTRVAAHTGCGPHRHGARTRPPPTSRLAQGPHRGEAPRTGDQPFQRGAGRWPFGDPRPPLERIPTGAVLAQGLHSSGPTPAGSPTRVAAAAQPSPGTCESPSPSRSDTGALRP